MSDMTLLIITPGSADSLNTAAMKLNNAIRPRSGEWITSAANNGAIGRNADVATYAPIVVPRSLTVTHLAAVVTDAVNLTDVTMRLGLYADDGTERAPDARLIESGELPVSEPGIYTYALPTPLVLSEGKVWAVCVLHGTLDNDNTGDPGCLLLSTDGRDDSLVVADPAQVITRGLRRCRAQDGVNDALPATAVADDADAAYAYRVFLKIA